MSSVPQALILAGGLGTRLRTVIPDKTKVLGLVAGRPFLAYLFEQVARAGITEAVLCTGYLGEQVQEAFGPSFGSLKLVYSQEKAPLGTAGALRLALPLIRSGMCLVMNGDSYIHADLGAFLFWHKMRGLTASMLLTWVGDASRYGTVDVDEGGNIRAFKEKQVGSPGWINAGVYLVDRGLIEALPEATPLSLERQGVPAWISSGMGGLRTEADFIDIGTPESYARAEAFFENLGAGREC